MGINHKHNNLKGNDTKNKLIKKKITNIIFIKCEKKICYNPFKICKSRKSHKINI